MHVLLIGEKLPVSASDALQAGGDAGKGIISQLCCSDETN